MLKLLKNVCCYCPDYTGKNDIIICGERIYKLKPNIKSSDLFETVFDCEGKLAFPGLIDQHVHIIGGGGENGFTSLIPEISVGSIINAGITSIVGLLGADDITRGLFSLYAKAKALESQGITTYIYSGSYHLPISTLTQSITNDLVFIDKVIGVGEIALSDHRSSYPDLNCLLRTASEIHLGGMLGGKAGVMHIHMGDGKDGMRPLIEIIENSDLPKEEFIPTHVNRNPKLFEQAVSYCLNGGNIDLTSGEKSGIPVPDAVKLLLDKKADLMRVTISSDANGSSPDGGVNEIMTLYEDVVNCIKDKHIDASTVFSMVTENVARALKVYPQKGTLKEGSDADILITDQDFNICKLFSRGNLILDIK